MQGPRTRKEIWICDQYLSAWNELITLDKSLADGKGTILEKRQVALGDETEGIQMRDGRTYQHDPGLGREGQVPWRSSLKIMMDMIPGL